MCGQSSIIACLFLLQDNIQQFLAACKELGMKDAQLFDCMALQKPQGAKAR